MCFVPSDNGIEGDGRLGGAFNLKPITPPLRLPTVSPDRPTPILPMCDLFQKCHCARADSRTDRFRRPLGDLAALGHLRAGSRPKASLSCSGESIVGCLRGERTVLKSKFFLGATLPLSHDPQDRAQQWKGAVSNACVTDVLKAD